MEDEEAAEHAAAVAAQVADAREYLEAIGLEDFLVKKYAGRERGKGTLCPLLVSVI